MAGSGLATTGEGVTEGDGTGAIGTAGGGGTGAEGSDGTEGNDGTGRGRRSRADREQHAGGAVLGRPESDHLEVVGVHRVPMATEVGER